MQFIQEGGATMWLLLLCSFASNPIALVALAAAFLTKKPVWQIGLGVVALVCGAMTMLFGVGSYFYWMSIANEALVHAAPENRALLMEYGRSEALNNIWLGLCGAALPLLLGGFAVVRGVMRSPETD